MIPFSPPYIDQDTIDEVIDTLKSGWITTGPKTKLFEKKISSYCTNKSTVAVNSATAGLELILRWFGVKEGDEVILPAYTYCATANVVMHCGATPVMIDSNTDDYNLNTDLIESLITEKTKVIMPVDISGLPCDYDKINAIIQSKSVVNKFKASTAEQEKLGRILVLSDAAHSFGASYKNRKTGSLADVSVFSFHAVKNLTTAEGGAICLNLPESKFNNDDLYKEFCIKILHGQSKDALAKTNGSWKYDVLYAGYKCNMTDIQASIGLKALERYDHLDIPRRKTIFDSYSQAFASKEWCSTPLYVNDEKESSYHLYMLKINEVTEQQRDLIIEKIIKNGVSVNVHFQPLPLLTAYKNEGYNMADYPQAYKNYSQEISLPVYVNLTDEQVNTVTSTVINAVEEVLNLESVK